MTRKQGIGTRRGRVTLFMTVGAASLAFPAIVFACTPQAMLSAHTSHGPVGAQVTVDGKMFNPGPVEVRWGTNGPLLATPVATTSTGPNSFGAQFTVTVTVPSVSSGPYYITGTQGAYGAKAAYQVIAPKASASGAPPVNSTRVPTAPPGGQPSRPVVVPAPAHAATAVKAAPPAGPGAAASGSGPTTGGTSDRSISNDPGRGYGPQQPPFGANGLVGGVARTTSGPATPVLVGVGTLAVTSLGLLGGLGLARRRRQVAVRASASSRVADDS